MPNIRRNNYSNLSREVGDGAQKGYDNFISKKEAQDEKLLSNSNMLKDNLEEKDRTDMSSNATGAFFKKKGY